MCFPEPNKQTKALQHATCPARSIMPTLSIQVPESALRAFEFSVSVSSGFNDNYNIFPTDVDRCSLELNPDKFTPLDEVSKIMRTFISVFPRHSVLPPKDKSQIKGHHLEKLLFTYHAKQGNDTASHGLCTLYKELVDPSTLFTMRFRPPNEENSHPSFFPEQSDSSGFQGSSLFY